ncbi:MAG: 1,4-alpha-glucan branching protein domain-containing protein [Solirubrobacteraceae bacterium]
MSRRPGGLAIVLHTHMPYVEGFGTWPFGEEWLWEAIACSYLPLLDVLEAAPGRVTLSVTPVLGDQLAAPGALGRCLAFLREIRPASHALDLPAATPAEADALEHSAAAYAWAADALAAGGLAERMARHATWTSSATHAVLPLLATDAGVRLQLATGIAAHRARSGDWGGGFWLPECAHAPWLDPLLVEAGVRLACVDLTDVAPRADGPLRPPAGPLLVPLDRSALELVWSRGGYPSRGAYRDTHRLTEHRHQAWAVDGAAYDPARAAALARADAADFVARVRALGRFCCVAWDTELLGLHWHEGVLFLAAVLELAEEAGLRIAPLDELVAEAMAEPVALDVATSWGAPRTLDTWSAPRAGGLAWRQRRAELRTLPGGSPRALRELLALQASDWAFLVAHGTAGTYPLERVEGHEAALEAALAEGWAGAEALRNLAPFLASGHG